MVLDIVHSGFWSAVLTLLVIFSLQTSMAAVMSSTNFKIQDDSINAGGLLASSTNFKIEDTVGEIATGESSSTNYILKAGYQQLNTVYMSISNIADVSMQTSLPGISGGVATGSASFVVTTDSPAGYTVLLAASGSPAMRNGVNVINDYTPTGAVPDFLFTTDPSDVHFAYSPEGSDIALRFQDSGGVCGVAGGDTSSRCWDGLSTTPVEIVRSTSPNHPLGATTTIRFAVGFGGAVPVIAGSYIATTTVTALPL